MAPRRPAGADAFPKNKVEPSSPARPRTGRFMRLWILAPNSCRMLIARPTGSQFQVVDSFSKPVQLGHGLEASGRLSRPSMARTVHALQVCRRKLEAA
jgi:exopolyphosphatase/guanosine-5'-triphosphate,3'-diphosphate pyrophosphatase